jgi:hypothetical protein
MHATQPPPSPSGWRSKVARVTPHDAIELFILLNLAGLGGDIFVAHSVNRFAHPAEWVPLIFSAVAPVLLLIAMAVGGLAARGRFAWMVGILVGVASIAVGVAGMMLHLHSQFFAQQTLKSLVYTAPFAAPLAYTGLGLLLILDRTVDPETDEWAGWVLLLATGGFLGNFVLSLADHAQNAFYRWTEWIPVVAAAFGTTFLMMPLLARVSRAFARLCAALMLLEALVGLLGFALHVIADLRGPSPSMRENFLYGAPAFAPLLFANLALLAWLGLWALHRRLPRADATSDLPTTRATAA